MRFARNFTSICKFEAGNTDFNQKVDLFSLNLGTAIEHILLKGVFPIGDDENVIFFEYQRKIDFIERVLASLSFKGLLVIWVDFFPKVQENFLSDGTILSLK